MEEDTSYSNSETELGTLIIAETWAIMVTIVRTILRISKEPRRRRRSDKHWQARPVLPVQARPVLQKGAGHGVEVCVGAVVAAAFNIGSSNQGDVIVCAEFRFQAL